MALTDQGQSSSDYPVKTVAPSSLMGGDPSSEGSATPNQQQEQSPDEGMKVAAQVIRQMMEGITSLAKQFPSAARSCRQAEVALRAIQRDIITQPGGAEPSAPQMAG